MCLSVCRLQGKIKTGKFYFEKMLPKADGHLGAMAGSKSIRAFKDEEFDAAYK